METRKLLLGLAALAILASPVLAAPTEFQFLGQAFNVAGTIKLDQLVLGWTGNAGPFEMYEVTYRDGYTGPRYAFDGLQTWCLEQGITFSPDKEYVFTINPLAWAGGPGTGGNGVPVHAGTEWIYDQWRAEALYGVEVNKISRAIHELQGQFPHLDPDDYSLLAKQAIVEAGDGVAQYTWALNLWSFKLVDNEWVVTDHQSHAVPIPAPGAILLAGIGTTLVGWLRRRKSI